MQSKQYFYNENQLVPYLCGADNKIYCYLFQHGLNGLGAANCVVSFFLHFLLYILPIFHRTNVGLCSHRIAGKEEPCQVSL